MKSIIYIIFLFGAVVSNAQSLAAYQKTAAENNPGLQAKYKEFEAALQMAAQVSSLPDPNLTVSAFGQMIETRVGPQQARFSLSQMFPWFGTLSAQGNVASLMAEAKYQDFLDARNQLYYEVASAYYPLYRLHFYRNIERENLQLLESYKTIATSKFSNASGSMTDVLRVDIIMKSAATSLAILDKQEQTLKASFNKLLNQEVSEEVLITDSIELDSVETSTAKDSLLINQPILTGLELRLEGSQAAEYAAQKQGMPKLGVGLDYIIVGKRSDLAAGVAPPADNGKDAIMPMVSVSLPIFRKKYRSAIKEAQVMQEAYTLQRQEAANKLEAGFEMVVFEMEKQQTLLDLYEAQSEETRQLLRLLFSSYSNSGKDFEDLLAIQQQLLQYEKMKVEAEVNYQTTVAQFNYLTAKAY